MSGLQILVKTSATGARWRDFSTQAQGATFSGNANGFAHFSCFVPMPLYRQFSFYDRAGFPHLQVNWQGATIWEGRMEDVTITASGLKIGAFGYQRALSDIPYTGLWSYTKVANWRQTTETDVATRAPAKYVLDNNNRLFFGLKKNETYANATEAGQWSFAAPYANAQNVVEVTFTYTMLLPVDWNLALQSWNYDYSGFVSEWNLAATGVVQTGTVTQTLASPKDRISFRIVNQTGAAYNWAGETGANYARITSLRVKGFSGSTLYADSVVGELIAFVNATNSTQLSSTTGMVNSPALDLQDEVYEDAAPRDILDRLALFGDGANVYEWGVWNDRVLRFGRKGTWGRTWYVDVAKPEIERTLNALRNSMYATYRDARGDTLRTAASANAFSVARYGVTRQGVVSSSSTSSTQAGAERDAALADTQTPRPRIGLTISALYDAAGQRYPPFLLRANDTVVMRNLSPAATADVDRIRIFRVAEYEYDADSGAMRVTPEAPLPTLKTMLARRENDLAVAPQVPLP